MILSFGEYFSHSLQYCCQHQFNPIKTTASQPLKEADLVGFVLLHALSSTQNLTLSVLVYHNRHQNGHILKLSTQISTQVDFIHVDIRVPPALQRTVPPILDLDIRFLIQLTDGYRKHLTAPHKLSNIFYAPDRYSGQVHLDERASSTQFSR